MIRARLGGAAVIAAITTGAGGVALAQHVDAETPLTLRVGAPAGARSDRVDGARSGLAPALPDGNLRVAWQVSTGVSLDHAPLVDAEGQSYVVGSDGEVVALARDGSERYRVATNAARASAAALLSDDTLVFVDGAGEAVGVKAGRVRWRSRFGRAGAASPAPLPLDDGGVVVATSRDLAALDADGDVRARVTLPQAVACTLLLADGEVVAVATQGAVWAWVPGAPEARRAGALGSAIDGDAAVAGDHTLVAVTSDGAALVAFDLVGHAATVRAAAGRDLWRGPPAVVDGIACLIAFEPGSELAVALDESGQSVARRLLAARPVGVTSTTPGAAPARPTEPSGTVTPPLVDPNGTLAFATADGGVGVAAALAPVHGRPAAPPARPAPVPTAEVVRDVCPSRVRPTATGGPPVAGLAPLPAGGPAALLVACRSGTVLALVAGGRPGKDL